MNEDGDDVDAIPTQFIDHQGETFKFFQRSLIVTKYHCIYKPTNQCPAILWIWNDSRRSLLNCHLNHPNEDRDRDYIVPQQSGRIGRERIRGRGTARRARNLPYPTIPNDRRPIADIRLRGQIKSLTELGVILNNLTVTNNVFRGTVHSGDQSTAFIFANMSLLQRMEENTIYIDTSMRLVPTSPRLSHLLMVLVHRAESTIPLMLSLCSAQSEELYRSIFRQFLEFNPRLTNNIRTVVTSMDGNLVGAIRSSFPTCRIEATWMQVMRNFTQNWCSLNLPLRINDHALRLSWSLPLVPDEYRPDAFQLTSAAGRRIEDEYPNVAIFLRHIERFDGFFRQSGPLRIQNITENYTEQLLRLCRRNNPSLNVLLQCISTAFTNGVQEMNRPPVLNTNNQFSNRNIDQLRSNLLASQITVQDFLATSVDRYQQDLILRAVASEASLNVRVPRLTDLQDPPNVINQRTYPDRFTPRTSSTGPTMPRQLMSAEAVIDDTVAGSSENASALDDTLIISSDSNDEDYFINFLVTSVTDRRASTPSGLTFNNSSAFEPSGSSSSMANLSSRRMSESSPSTSGLTVNESSASAPAGSSPAMANLSSSRMSQSSLSTSGLTVNESSASAPASSSPAMANLSSRTMSEFSPSTSSLTVNESSASAPASSSPAMTNLSSRTMSEFSPSTSSLTVNESSASAPAGSSPAMANLSSSSMSQSSLSTSGLTVTQSNSACDDEEIIPEGTSICCCCRFRAAVWAFIKCGHLCLCNECNKKIGDRCPLCREKSRHIKIFTNHP